MIINAIVFVLGTLIGLAFSYGVIYFALLVASNYCKFHSYNNSYKAIAPLFIMLFNLISAVVILITAASVASVLYQ
jgi:ABC-type nitrate/sulfonate/bicarbonate transport system permease component